MCSDPIFCCTKGNGVTMRVVCIMLVDRRLQPSNKVLGELGHRFNTLYEPTIKTIERLIFLKCEARCYHMKLTLRLIRNI